MRCSSFVRSLEEYLANHPDTMQVNGELGAHAARCRRCRAHLNSAVRSRLLLASLRTPQQEAVDPFFLTRLHARIEAQSAERSRGFLQRRLAWRDVLAATLLFAFSLGSFVYDVHHTEAPNVDEAMVLDVPHVHTQQPLLDHRHTTPTDVLLSLLNP